MRSLMFSACSHPLKVCGSVGAVRTRAEEWYYWVGGLFLDKVLCRSRNFPIIAVAKHCKCVLGFSSAQ